MSDPLDLNTIEKQIVTGHYKTVEAFDTDMLKVFRNAEVSRDHLFFSLIWMFFCIETHSIINIYVFLLGVLYFVM